MYQFNMLAHFYFMNLKGNNPQDAINQIYLINPKY